MGGTASVVQHGVSGSRNKTDETALLKLYNRNRRDDTGLSEHQMLMACVEDSKVGGVRTR